MTILGEAFVHVRPDETGFGEELGGQLNKVLANKGLVFGALAAAGVAAAIDIGEHFADAFHTIEERTGATGTALGGLEKSFQNVFASTPGANFKNVADALSEVEIRTGLTGTALEEMTRKEVELGKITKSDVGATVQSTTALLNKMGVTAKDQAADLDVLFKASQNSGKSIGDLASDMTRATPALSGLNLNFGQQAALVSSLEKAGVKVQPVIMGLAKSFKEAASAGKDPISVVTDLVAKIQGASSPTEQFSIAVAALGARAGGEFVAAVNSGAFSIDGLAASLTSGAGGIDATAEATMSLGDKFGLLKNKVLVALEPISMKLLDLLNVVVDGIEPAFAGLVDFAEGTFGPVFRELADDLSSFFYTLRTGFTEDEGTPLEEFALRIRDLWPQVRDAVVGAWDAIRPALQAFGSFLGDNLQPIVIGLAGYVVFLAGSSVIGALATALTALVGAVSLPVVAIAALVAGLVYAYQNFDGFRNVVDETASALVSAFRAVASFLGPILANLASSVADLASYFADRWGKIHDAVVNVLEALKIAVAVWVAPFVLAWRYFHDQILAVLKGAWDNVVLVVQTAVRIIGDVFDLFISLLSGDWGAAWDDVKDILGAAVDFMLGAVGNFGSFLLDFFSSLPGNIVSALGDLAGLLAPAAAALMAGLYDGIRTGVIDVFNFFVNLPNNVVALVIGIDKWLLQAGLDLLTGLWDGIVAKAPDVWKWFTDLPGTLQGMFSSALTWLKNAGIDVVQGVLNGIVAGAEAIWTWLKNLPDNLRSWFATAVTWLYNVGRDLVQGILNGIESMGSSIADAIRSKIPGGNLFVPGGGGTSAGIFNNNPTDSSGHLIMPPSKSHAKGGIFDRATWGLFGEAGREVIIPLTDPARARELAAQSGLLDMLAAGGGSGSSGSGGGGFAGLADVIRQALGEARQGPLIAMDNVTLGSTGAADDLEWMLRTHLVGI